MSLWRRQETKGRKKGGGKRKDKKREKRRRGKRLDYYYWCYYYFAISYKYSFLLLDESGRLALQAVSRVKSANERLLQGSEKGASPRRFPSSPSYPCPVSFLRGNSARQPRGAPSCANLFN